jgi:hypothetical protein
MRIQLVLQKRGNSISQNGKQELGSSHHVGSLNPKIDRETKKRETNLDWRNRALPNNPTKNPRQSGEQSKCCAPFYLLLHDCRKARQASEWKERILRWGDGGGGGRWGAQRLSCARGGAASNASCLDRYHRQVPKLPVSGAPASSPG